MYSKFGKTKTEIVTETLRTNIFSEKFPDGALPSKLELADHFAVSHRTIDAALKTLRNEGLIRGVRGTGIFVNREPQDVNNLTHRMILQFSPGDTYHESEPYASLRHEIFRRNYFPVNLPLLHANSPHALAERASMTQLLRAPIRGVVYDGRSYWREKFLENYKNVRSVSIVHFDADCELPGSGVFVNYVHGGRILAQHMLENGARRLALIGSYIAPDVPKSAEYWQKHPSHLCLKGATEITDSAALPKPELFFIENKNYTLPIDWRQLSTFDGIICCSDDMAFRVIEEMKKINIHAPQDILIAGQQETIWSSGLGNEITTYSINPALLSKHAIDLLEAGNKQTIYIKPSLIVRKSTSRKQL